jgi:hypothetical protein
VSALTDRLSEDDIRWLAAMNRRIHARHIARLEREQEQEREHCPAEDEPCQSGDHDAA